MLGIQIMDGKLQNLSEFKKQERERESQSPTTSGRGSEDKEKKDAVKAVCYFSFIFIFITLFSLHYYSELQDIFIMFNVLFYHYKK